MLFFMEDLLPCQSQRQDKGGVLFLFFINTLINQCLAVFEKCILHNASR